MSPLILDEPRRARRRQFIVSPAEKTDVRRLVDIEFSAFENEQVNQVLSYRDYKKPAHFARTIRLYESALQKAGVETQLQRLLRKRGQQSAEYHAEDDGARVSFKKVTDARTGEIVSFSKLERKRYSIQEMDLAADVGHEGEDKMNRDWFALNERLKREYLGLAEHYYIAMLATLPKHQHHGAGTQLLEEILAQADDAGLEVYLEATDTAKSWYSKYGFEAITELRFDPAVYGVRGLGIERQTVMVRGALGRDGERRAVRSWDVAASQARAEVRRARAMEAAMLQV